MSEAPYTASNRTIHLWALGGVAEYMLYVCFGALVLPVFTMGFGLDPKLVGWALALPRLFDAILDPILGHLSDVTHTRWGRRRPFLFGAAVIGAAVVIGIWWPSQQWPESLQFAWMVVASVLVFTCYGIYSMNNMAFGYELSDDYHNRAKVMGVRGFYWGIAAVAGGYLYWLTQRPFFGNEITGIRMVSLGMAACVLVFGLIPVFCCRERFPRANRRHVNLGTALRTTLHVRPFVMLLVLRFSQTLGTTLYGIVGLYIVFYSVCGGDKSLGASLSIPQGWLGFACAIGLMFAAAPLCRTLGKRWGIVLGFGAGLAAAVTLPFFAQPGHPYLYLAQVLFFIPLVSLREMFMAAVMPDICDIDELQSGERREALFAAVMAFVSKFENSIIALVSGYLLSYIGFDGKLAQQPQEVLDRLRFWGFGALILFSAVAFVVSWYVPITEEYMRDVRARLEQRRRTGTSVPAAAPQAGPSAAVPVEGLSENA